MPEYARRASEFEIQAQLYNSLLANGFDVRGEVTVRGKNERGRFQLRMDLVLYENGAATHIVEVKARPVRHSRGVQATRQAKRYQAFGLPVTFVYGAGDAESFLRQQLQRRNESSTCEDHRGSRA